MGVLLAGTAALLLTENLSGASQLEFTTSAEEEEALLDQLGEGDILYMAVTVSNPRPERNLVENWIRIGPGETIVEARGRVSDPMTGEILLETTYSHGQMTSLDITQNQTSFIPYQPRPLRDFVEDVLGPLNPWDHPGYERVESSSQVQIVRRVHAVDSQYRSVIGALGADVPVSVEYLVESAADDETNRHDMLVAVYPDGRRDVRHERENRSIKPVSEIPPFPDLGGQKGR